MMNVRGERHVDDKASFGRNRHVQGTIRHGADISCVHFYRALRGCWQFSKVQPRKSQPSNKASDDKFFV